MSEIALLVDHPLYVKVTKLLEKTAGRDKLMRALQYWSRFLAYFFLRNGYSKNFIDFWSRIDNQMSLSRKLFRLGKPLSFYKTAATFYHQKTADRVLRLTSIWRNIFHGSYLVLDGLVWLHKSNVRPFSPNKSSRILKASYRMWLAALICGIINHGYSLNSACKTKKALLEEKDKDAESLKLAELKEKQATRGLLTDLLDLTIPCYNLGYARFLDPGAVGLAGFITSVWGLEGIWNGL